MPAGHLQPRGGGDKFIIAKKTRLQQTTEAADDPAYVAAQSRLLAILSQEISDEINKHLNK